ncbi:MAG: hypothetical protein GC159_17485 [Phycisphaera sp.]|nr:hypothetical protein [Phycisphaera sp.]
MTDRARDIANNVPGVLKARRQWVCWRYEDRGDGGKRCKRPIDSASGRAADPSDPGTWGSFDDAMRAWRGDSSLDGVGFVFTADDPFCGIDLDDCLDGDHLDLWARRLVDCLLSYTEVSPSGRGVKVFVEGSKPGDRCRTRVENGEIEMYDSHRFFTVTGRRLSGSPLNVEARGDVVHDIYVEVFGDDAVTSPAPPTPNSPTRPAAPLTDDEIIDVALGRRTANAEKFRRLWAGEWDYASNSRSESDASIVFTLAYYTKDPDQLDRLYRRSGLFRDKWDEPRGDSTYGRDLIAKALSRVTKQYKPRKTRRRAAPRRADVGADDSRPTVVIDTDEYRVVEQTVVALRADPGVFQRGGVLVRIIRTQFPEDQIKRQDGSPVINLLPPANLRERITRWARFVKINRDGEQQPAHPTGWLVSAIDARGEWSGIPYLSGVSDAPVLRPDGTVFQTRGYDEQTGVMYEPSSKVEFPSVHPEATVDDAQAAIESLLEVVHDFPFKSDEHRAAWLASVLTPLARYAFRGPSPLFLLDANIAGAGKGLLGHTIGRIVLGREMPTGGYAHDPEEMRKKITAIAIAGDRMVMLDNIDGAFGNDALDRALTTTRWKDRILGRSEEIDLPLTPSWYATGNNVQVAADTARRIIHVRLDAMQERPEERTGFLHPDLVEWIDANRPRLLCDALTVLSAYLRCGRPDQSLTPYGSFEGWSDVVRQAIVWAGMPDPCLTRAKLAETSDTTADTLEQLLSAWKSYDPSNEGVVVSALLRRLYPGAAGDLFSNDEDSAAMRAALESMVGCPPHRAPTPRQVGNKLRLYRRRVMDGAYIDIDPSAGRKHGAVWRLHRA